MTDLALQGRTGPWLLTIGLETHAQIASASKIFSESPTVFGSEPNTQVSLVDAAMPGMLPVVNMECVRLAVKTALGLGCTVHSRSAFDRKHYFYPDLPQGYQISQYAFPIATEGSIRLNLEDGEVHTVRIERLHMEQDAGKSIHDLDPDHSYVDLNRSGVGLMEIVSAPDMRSAEEAKAYLTQVRSIVRNLGTCDGNMEQGSLRADVNVSVRRPGEPLGTRCEIKNVNSIRFVGQAIRYEAARQIDLLEDGHSVVQQTRLFDPKSGETRAMRSKEEAHDYRYFPCPDLPVLYVAPSEIEAIAASLPELPDARRDRYMEAHGLSAVDASVLAEDPAVSEEFEALANGRDGAAAARWMLGEVFALRNKVGEEIARQRAPIAHVGALMDLLAAGDISGRQAKDVFEVMGETGQHPDAIVQERGWRQQSDTEVLRGIIETILENHPKQVAQVKEKPKTLGWFVGQVMAQTKGSANPHVVNTLLRERLGLND